MFVKPAEGLKIRDPDLKDLIPDEGREVPDDNFYWHRRVRDGDVVLVEAKADESAQTEPKLLEQPGHQSAEPEAGEALDNDRSV